MQKKFKKKGLTRKDTVAKTTKEQHKLSFHKSSSRERYLQGLSLLVLVVLIFLVYQPALDNDFVDWDDHAYVIDNDLVRQRNTQTTTSDIFSHTVSLNYHPITIMTMRWNNNICPECPNGISAEPFIKWNIILHMLNTIMVFFLTFLLSKRKWFVGIFCAAVFALHPMHVESVAWVSERKDVLYVFFFLTGLLSYNRYLETSLVKNQRPEYKWLVFAFICFVLSCLSKAMAVVFPLVMMLLCFWKDSSVPGFTALRNTFSKKRVLEYLPFLAVSLFFGLMALSVQSGKDFGGMLTVSGKDLAVNEFGTFTVIDRFEFAAYGFWMYIYKFFVPMGLSALHPYPSQGGYDNSSLYILLLLLAIIVLAAVVWSIKRTRLLAFGMGFYFFTTMLILQFISVGVALTADRYTYLPYIGLSFILATLAETLTGKIRYSIYGMGLIVCIVWFIQTRSQADKWQDSDSLWTQVIKLYPKNDQAYGIRGNYYGKRASFFASKGDTAIQRQYVEKAEQDFETAIQLSSKRVDVYEGMGNIQGIKGNRNEALKMYGKAIEMDPQRSSSYLNRGVTYELLGNYQEALKDYTKATEINPDPIHFLYRGMVREKLGDIEGAKADYRKVRQLAPNNSEAAKRLQALGG